MTFAIGGADYESYQRAYDELIMCCTVTRAIREDNIPSWKTIEKASFCADRTKKYRDINDDVV